MADQPEPRLAVVTVGASAGPWQAAGFAVAGDRCSVGATAIRFAGEGRGILEASFSGLAQERPDGLDIVSCGPSPEPDASEHPLGLLRLDHLVALTPDLERTVDALEQAGLRLRRLREEPTPAGAPRQAFFRIGEPILEVVQEPADVVAERGRGRPARLWGMAFAIADMDRAVELLGESLGEPRPAVQKGRTIATVRGAAGLGVAVALMTDRQA